MAERTADGGPGGHFAAGLPVAGGSAVAPPRSGADLPHPLTLLIGREREAAVARDLLLRDDVRLVTLTGPGGIGKTRLALRVVGELAAEFADGVRFVPLAGIPEPERVPDAIADALGIGDVGGRPMRDVLTKALRESDTLLVLDNFEHLLDAADLVTDLLAACPRLTVLVTSQTLLRVSGEHALPVPPLDLPVLGEGASPEDVARAPAVRLFAERAAAVAPSFALTAATVPVVTDICRRLDGLPLAIELAAARVNHFPVVTLRDRLDQRLALLSGGARDAPARHRTMRDAIAWSHDLLTEEEQAIFRRLAVFVGGFTLEAAEVVCGPPSAFVLDVVGSLVDKSLVQQEVREGQARFSMLEIIRGYALEQLVGSGEGDAVADAHAAWCLDLAERSSLAAFLPGGEQDLRGLEVEHANVQAALDWLERRDETDRLLRLAAALGRFWYAHSHYREGRNWLERALARGPDASRDVRARAMVWLAWLLDHQGQMERAQHLVAEGIVILRGEADVLMLALALVLQGAIANHRGTYDQAERALEEALVAAAAIQNPVIASSVTGIVLANLGLAAHGRGDFDLARARHEQSLRICREDGYALGIIRSLRDLGDVTRDQGDHAASVAFYRDCLSLLGERGDLRVVIDALEGSAMAAAVWQQPERAARLLGAAEVLREQQALAVVVPTDRVAHERTVAAILAVVDDHDLKAAWSAGRALTLAAAIAEVQAMSPPAAERTVDRSDVKLSPREEEVLRLLAAGLPDREIAAALFLSVRTVEGHVARILAKLGAPTRTAAARAAIGAGLVVPHAPVRGLPPDG